MIRPQKTGNLPVLSGGLWVSSGPVSGGGSSWLRSPLGTGLSIPSGTSSSSGTSRGGSGSESTSSWAGDLPVSGTSRSEAGIDGSGTDLIGTWDLSLLGDLLVLLGLRVAVEVQIDHDVPVSLAVGDGTSQAEDLTGKHPPDETDGVAGLVVGWDGNVDELSWGVSVAKGNDWDVDVGSLLDGLGIGTGVGNDDETGLLERAGDVVGEVTRGEATGNGDGTGVVGELQDSALSVRASGDNADVGGVVDGCDDTGSEDNLLPKRIR